MNLPNTRNQIGRWLNEKGLVGLGVELGTHRGEFAEAILSEWVGERLFCVDCWSAVLDDPLLYERPPTDEEQARHFAFARARLSRFGNRVSFVQKFSADAAVDFNASSLDFVYVDASHDRDAVLADLRLWWGKVKAGGVLCGDDFTPSYPGVIEAVRSFANEIGQVLYVTSGETRPQWYILK